MNIDDLYALAERHPKERADAFALARQATRANELDMRAASADVVAQLGTPNEALEVLERLADDGAPGVRLAAVAAAAGLPWRGRVQLLERKTKDADRGIVLTAADGLAWAGDERAAPVLRTYINDRRLRFDALDALLTLGDSELEQTAERLFGSFFTPLFEKALAAVVLAAKGRESPREYLRHRLTKKRAPERPFIVIHLAEVDPVEGRKRIEELARAEDDYLRESALLALTRLDRAYWPQAQEAIGRWADDDPHVSSEVLLGLFEIDWARASLIADAHVRRDSELGVSARRLRLQAALRAAHPEEVLVR